MCERISSTAPQIRRVAPVLAACAVVTLAYCTWRRNQDYGSELRIWQTVVAARPQNARAYVSRGIAWMKLDQLDAKIAIGRLGVERTRAVGHLHIAIHRAQVPAHHEPHRQVQNAAGLPGRVDRDDVRMVHRRDGTRLPHEPLTELSVAGACGRKDLQCDRPAKRIPGSRIRRFRDSS